MTAEERHTTNSTADVDILGSTTPRAPSDVSLELLRVSQLATWCSLIHDLGCLPCTVIACAGCSIARIVWTHLEHDGGFMLVEAIQLQQAQVEQCLGACRSCADGQSRQVILGP